MSESSRALLVSSPGLPTCPDCAWYGLGWMVRGYMICLTVLESFKIVLDCRSLIIRADCRDKLVFTLPRFAPSQWGIGTSKQTFGVHTGEHGRLLLEQWVAARPHSSSGQSTSSQGTFHCSRLHRSSDRFGAMRALPGQSLSMAMSLKTLYQLY